MSAILKRQTIFDEIGMYPLDGRERYPRALDRFYIAEIGMEAGCPECDRPVTAVCIAIPRRLGFRLFAGGIYDRCFGDPAPKHGEVLIRPCGCIVPLVLFDAYLRAYLDVLGEGDDQS